MFWWKPLFDQLENIDALGTKYYTTITVLAPEKYHLLHSIIVHTSSNSDIERLFTSSVFGCSRCKTLISVEYMSNGVVSRFMLLFRLDANFGYFRSNHLGSTNEKNGIRSSSLPCCVSRTDANLRMDNK